MFVVFLRLGRAELARSPYNWDEELSASEPTEEPTSEADFYWDEELFASVPTALEVSNLEADDASFLELDADLTETPTSDPTATPTHDPTGTPTSEGTHEFNPNGRIPTCPPQTKTGYLKNTAGKYLTCTNESCRWAKFDPTGSQLFRQEPAHHRPTEKWSMFKVYTPSGAPTGQCLNQFTNEAGQHKLRVASCDIWTSRRWMLCSGFLHANMWKCLQSNAGIAPCLQSHVKVTLESPKCIMTSVTIDKLTCESPVTGGGCASTGFDQGTLVGAHSRDVCDACDAAKGSSQSCSFSFAKTTTNTVTNTWSDAFTWQVGASFSVTESFLFGSATQQFSFQFSQTLTSGKATTISTSVTDNLGCSVQIEPGTKESAVANFLVGEIHADFAATVTQHWVCNTGLKKKKSFNEKMTLKISNVPTQSIIGSCMTKKQACPNTLANRLSPPTRFE